MNSWQPVSRYACKNPDSLPRRRKNLFQLHLSSPGSDFSWQCVLILAGLLFLLQACAQKQEQRIPDLASLPQDPGFYLQEAQGGQEPFLDSQEQEKAAQEFLQSW
ncbi:MAG: NlpC/P60 family N-terminal domain-containing protein, partial [Desulfohalobiaceae bacterium]